MDSNVELIVRARQGDDVAFSQMCDKYKNLIENMSRKYSSMCSKEYSAQDDFLQEAKMAFYNAIVKYDIENNKVTFGAFAKVCVRNKLISCVRKQNSKKRLQSRVEDAQARSSASVQDTVVRRELGEKLIAIAENTLSSYEKLIFSMYLDNRKAKEISLKIGKSEKSVNNAIYRIRLKLKKTVK